MRRNSMCSISRSADSRVFEAIVGHQQRVAAGEQHIADLGVSAEVVEDVVHPSRQRIERTLTDETRPGAVAAVGCAGVEGEEKDPVGVAVHEPFDRRRVVLAARVLHVAGADGELVRRRHHLAADRTVRVMRIHERREVRCHRHGKTLGAHGKTEPFMVRQLEVGLEVVEGGQTVAKLPAPVVPGGRVVGFIEHPAQAFAVD